MFVSRNADNVIAIYEEAQRGVFINSNENFATDFESLLGTLFAGEKRRSVASTVMNERSSRSHTTFRNDKGESERVILWTGNGNGNGNNEEGTNLTEMEATITSKMTIMMTMKTMI